MAIKVDRRKETFDTVRFPRQVYTRLQLAQKGLRDVICSSLVLPLPPPPPPRPRPDVRPHTGRAVGTAQAGEEHSEAPRAEEG